MSMYSISCKICHQMGFPDRHAWKIHQISNHKTEFCAMCEPCCKTFKSFTGYNDHNSLHHGSPHSKQLYTCQVCLKSFISQYKLEFHERAHSNEKPFQCRKCRKGYKYKKDLTKHELKCVLLDKTSVFM